MTRRQFIIGSSMAMATGCRCFRRNERLKVALIGCGGRMRVLLSGAIQERIVALCDPDETMLAATVKRMRQLGVAETEIAQLGTWRDYRKLFEEIGDELDAVIIAAPNHHHCLPAVLAMRRGIHVYVEKPMAMTVAEARLMREVARETGVVTQVGNQGQSTANARAMADLVAKGALGEISDVWVFDDRLNAMMERPNPVAPPKCVDWDLWCGGSPLCGWYPAAASKHGALHPHDFHSWIGYGNGSIGNMGTHLIGPAAFSLKLYETAPTTMRLENLRMGCRGSWNVSAQVEWQFPAHSQLPGVLLHWFDGVKDGVPYDQQHVDYIGICRKREYQNVPPAIFECEKRYGENFGQLGTLFVGSKGVAFMDFHCQRLRVLPKDFGDRTLAGHKLEVLLEPPDVAHVHNFYAAVRGDESANCDFERSEPLAELILQVNAMVRAGEGSYGWRDGRFTGDKAAANDYLKAVYRPGWNPFV